MGGPVLRAISPDATPEEIAAIVAAIATLSEARASGTGGSDSAEVGLREWERGSRLMARGAPLQRGPWRLSGRIEPRSQS